MAAYGCGYVSPEWSRDSHVPALSRMSLVGTAAALVAFPVAASTIGAVVAAVRPPGPRFVSGVQHFAAGVVTAAAAATLPIGMLGAMAVDLLLDGVLLGLGVRLGSTQGVILTIALTLEILFLGLSVVAELTESGNSPRRAVLICTMLGLMTAVGAIGSALFLASISTTVMSAVLAFGAAALLYLVVEELLVEAHEERESVWLGAMFFLGFILIYAMAAFGE